ncbi:hypothetical protein LY76DRAFT_399593, partial [Colletotrichum caudatum]
QGALRRPWEKEDAQLQLLLVIALPGSGSRSEGQGQASGCVRPGEEERAVKVEPDHSLDPASWGFLSPLLSSLLRYILLVLCSQRLGLVHFNRSFC